VRESVQDARHTLALSGELDMSTASELIEALDRICSKCPDAVTLDLGV
jgi:ABC-type transporter Mla MlaB component